MNQALVSVIVPTRNSARALEACLRSVRAQGYAPIELIVVDNASTDGTQAIAARHADLSFGFGPERSAQRNEGARRAKGEFVVFIDSDMVLTENVMAACVNAMPPGVAGVVIPEESFGEGFWAQCKKLERSFYVGVSWMEAARFFRRADVLAAGGYDETLVSGEDWDLSQRMERRGTVSRIADLIFHDEGRLTLGATLRKKSYYAKAFAKYAAKREHAGSAAKQTGILSRYWLFLSRPGKLFAHPLIGFGMLFMKTCEFAAGAAGYASARFGRL
jgi:glycosyltransferase involved in cell wall biosynthesis